MDIDRRKLIVGASALTAIAASQTVAACSPPDDYLASGPHEKFFVALASRQLPNAEALLIPSASMTMITSEKTQMFSGPAEVVKAFNQLMNVQGLTLLGDNRQETLGGMYWREMGPWICTDLAKDNKVTLDSCGGGVMENVFNVLIARENEKIQSIILLENRELMVQWFDAPEIFRRTPDE